MRVILFENREVKMRGKHSERDHADALTQNIFNKRRKNAE